LDFVVLATGQSVTPDQVEYVREMHQAGKCGAIAISDMYQLAPWADALVSNDPNWWGHHPEASKFEGRKFCGAPYPGTERLEQTGEFNSGVNSGLQGMRVARDVFHASRIVLVGFDMHGTHYFGLHPEPLFNTTVRRFLAHMKQFDGWRFGEVINCTPGSALKRFPTGELSEVLRS
jgi:hypothetical protein